jgi:hypothetical protein
MIDRPAVYSCGPCKLLQLRLQLLVLQNFNFRIQSNIQINYSMFRHGDTKCTVKHMQDMDSGCSNNRSVMHCVFLNFLIRLLDPTRFGGLHILGSARRFHELKSCKAAQVTIALPNCTCSAAPTTARSSSNKI